MEENQKYMMLALEQAKMSLDDMEVPVGCVIIHNGKVIGKGRNRREKLGLATAHAEIEAINEACKALGTWRLSDCSMYVTLEPCPMCTGAIINARIGQVYYGTKEKMMGSCGSVINLFQESYGFEPKLVGGILQDECSKILTDFFKKIRKS